MGNTIHYIPLEILPDDFFVEELQYKNKEYLEALLKNPPEKKQNTTIKLYLRDAFLQDEDFEQIEAYAPKSVIEKLLETAKPHEPEPVYDLNGNIVDYL